MNFDPWGSLGGPLGGFPGRLGGFLGRVEAILDGLDQPVGDSWPPQTISRTILGPSVLPGNESAELRPTFAGFCRRSARGRGQFSGGTPPQTPYGGVPVGSPSARSGKKQKVRPSKV